MRDTPRCHKEIMDFIGKRFGKIKVIKRNGSGSRGHSLWLCLCDCGNKKNILGYNLKVRGNKASCGCWHKEAVRKYIEEGSRFGRLKVFRFSRTINYRAAYICECDCGEIVEVKGEKLKSGATTSCGCYWREAHLKAATKHGLCYTSEYKRASASKRRGIKKAAYGSHTAEDILDLLRKQENRCFYCSKELADYHVDHKIPLSRGGSDAKRNLCVACPTCNLSKGNKTHREFRKLFKAQEEE